MKSADIRSSFLEYFKSKGHAVVASSPLVPNNDPTLLFVNSGMVQFKDVFLGKDRRSYDRAATSQRCVRAGGKHNDLENVGYTARHHTFFEMLGNFSFGDYFKQDAIRYAWELLTQVYKLPADKLWVTVYRTDEEAYDLWAKDIGVPPGRIVRVGDKPGGQKYQSDNFWQMADTGPCGPCSEIFYDHGPGIAGGPPGSADADGDRYIEIWNLVFMQFNRDDKGVMHPLPKPSVDTGMGLERIAAVLQHVHSNYEIDLFQDLIKAAARETHQKELKNPSLNVIADHIRACSFLIVDGVIPGNEGRGYVLRRIIRRAIRHGYKLGQKQPFFYRIVEDLDRAMGDAYPELRRNKQQVAEVLRQEEERFFETLERGMGLLERGLQDESLVISNLRRIYKPVEIGIEGNASQLSTGLQYSYDAKLTLPNHDEVVVEFVRAGPDAKQVIEVFKTRLDFFSSNADSLDVVELVLVVIGNTSESLRGAIESIAQVSKFKTRVLYVDDDTRHLYRTLDGRIAFTLHDTYGFPLDLTADVARERGITVDEIGFEAAMEEQRQRARAASQFSSGSGLAYAGKKTEFRGYDTLSLPAKVVALYREGSSAELLKSGEAGVVVLDQTPYYAESGGQVGDRGEIVGSAGTFAVADTQRVQAEVFGHHGSVTNGELRIGDTVRAEVNLGLRRRTMHNHSATHLMHAALRKVLGTHVQQKGSLVNEDRTRFDFAHNKPVTAEEIHRIEARVNDEIRHNDEVEARVMKYDDAIKAGALAFFGDKYGDEVRVLRMGDFSTELCGGTHVKRTGDIGFFKIVAESGVAAGVRRVEAVTGEGALAWVQQLERDVEGLAFEFGFQKGSLSQVKKRAASLQESNKMLEKELAKLKSKLAMGQGQDLASQAVDVKGANVLVATLEGADAKTLRETMDKLKDKLKSAAIVLGAVSDGKVSLIAGVTADLTGKVKAGELVNFVAQQVGGKGGGRPDMAQAGGTEPAKLAAALASVKDWVGQRV